jgi:hypothetical protein
LKTVILVFWILGLLSALGFVITVGSFVVGNIPRMKNQKLTVNVKFSIKNKQKEAILIIALWCCMFLSVIIIALIDT